MEIYEVKILKKLYVSSLEPGHISAHSGYHYPHLPWLSQNRACNYYIALNDVCSFILTSRPLFPQLGGHRIVVSVPRGWSNSKVPIYTRFLKNWPNVPSDFLEVEHQGVPLAPLGWTIYHDPVSSSLNLFIEKTKPSSRQQPPWPTDKYRKSVFDREYFTSWLEGSKVVSKNNLRIPRNF